MGTLILKAWLQQLGLELDWSYFTADLSFFEVLVLGAQKLKYKILCTSGNNLLPVNGYSILPA